MEGVKRIVHPKFWKMDNPPKFTEIMDNGQPPLDNGQP